MTVSSTSNRKEYTGNGVTTVFAFPYKFIATTDIKVYVAGVLQTSGYTVGTPSDSGANVTLSVAPANLASVVIINDPDLLQSSALPSTGPFPSTTVERMVDKVTLQVQRIRDLINRSFTLPDSDTSGASTTLPTPTAANIIGWNSIGSALKNYTPIELGITVAAGNQTVEYFDGTGAQVDFVLAGNPVANENTEVFISGVRQYSGAGKDYTLDSVTKTITFAVAPTYGTANIMVRYGGAADIGVPSDGTVGPAKIVDGAVTPAKTSGFGAWVTAASAALARTALGLGTAATKDTGTSAGQVVVLDGSAKLPAVDGSQLTGVAETYPTQTGNAGKFLGTDGTVASWSFPITIGTTVATTTGTSFDFTGIPATAKRITITVSGVSTNGTSNIIIQLGTASEFEVTGYTCAASLLYSGISITNSTVGFAFIGGVSASTSLHGDMAISLHDPAANKWVERAVVGQVVNNVGVSGGSKALAAPLTRIRLTTTNGTDTFDSGTINILVE